MNLEQALEKVRDHIRIGKGMGVHNRVPEALEMVVEELIVTQKALELACQKLSEANRKRKGVPHKKRRHIPQIQMYALLASGMSINGIAKYYGVDWSTIKSRIHDNPELLEGGAPDE